MSDIGNTKTQILLPLVLCVGLAGGIFIGAKMNTKNSFSSDTGKEVQKFREALSYIQKDYVDEVNTGELVDDAIKHMLTNLDPHSVYISARDTSQANEGLRGNFDGIGIEFNIFHDTVTVVSALSGGPSEALGIRSGDKIIKVDSTIIAGVGIVNADVMRYLKGPKGTQVKVEILRRGVAEPIVYNIIRDKIPTYSVDASYMVDNEIGYIKVSRFAATTYQEFQTALKKLQDQGMKKLVLDLQGNPGGYMDMAISMLDEFLPAGNKIVFTKGKAGRYDQEAFATNKGSFEKGDLIVLVNEGSASASEIVSGALQDNDRALVVGRRTFGKGLVQTTFNLNGGAEMRLTISRYYTPSGRSIQKPYEDGDEYDRDIINRYSHGEFFHVDSIKFNDSLKYTTQNGRTVYGGGGIMPDYFVALDTTLNSSYLNQLYISNAINEYTFDYAEKNRGMLEKMTFADFDKKFVVTDVMLNDLVATGKRAKVKPDYEELRIRKKIFQIHVKAQVARRIWGNDGFFPIFNQTNEIFLQAIKLFDHLPELNRQKM